MKILFVPIAFCRPPLPSIWILASSGKMSRIRSLINFQPYGETLVGYGHRHKGTVSRLVHDSNFCHSTVCTAVSGILKNEDVCWHQKCCTFAPKSRHYKRRFRASGLAGAKNHLAGRRRVPRAKLVSFESGDSIWMTFFENERSGGACGTAA